MFSQPQSSQAVRTKICHGKQSSSALSHLPVNISVVFVERFQELLHISSQQRRLCMLLCCIGFWKLFLRLDVLMTLGDI